MPPASATAVNNNTADAVAKEREIRLRAALKTFILKERQRKKEEFAARVEEDRLRREREAREREKDATLEEARGKMAGVETKLFNLLNQKQQLSLQLKKLLNEDENRKKLQKDNELYAIQALQAQQMNVPTPQVFLPPVRANTNTSVKRARSPSPPTQAYYKASTYPNKAATQYPTSGALFYQTTTASGASPQATTNDGRGPAIIYPAYNLPLRQGYHLELQSTSTVPPPIVSKASDTNSQKPTQVFHINLDQPVHTQSVSASTTTGTTVVPAQKSQLTMEKIGDRYVEVKHDVPTTIASSSSPHSLPEAVVYTSLISGMQLHPNNVMQITTTTTQNQKTSASITQGYGTGRPATSAHDQQIARQQLSALQGQTQTQTPQQIQYPRSKK